MNENILAFSTTHQGANHIKVDKVCEDASCYYSDDKMRICVVADGHGSDNYPRAHIGSIKAVEAASNCIKEFVEQAMPSDVLIDEKNNYSMMRGLSASILNKWHQLIKEDYEETAFTEEELVKVSDKYKKMYTLINTSEFKPEKAYGCTLIAYVVTNEYSFGLQIGDGKCVHIDKKGGFSEPIPWDDDCQMNITTSICDSDALDKFRFFISNQAPLAVFCGTDGIDDSYASSNELYAFYRAIINIFAEHGTEVGMKEIDSYLPTLSKKGSGDDVSLGLIFDCESAGKIKKIFEFQDEIYKLTSQLKEQKHQIKTIHEKIVILSKEFRTRNTAVKKTSNEPDNSTLKELTTKKAELETAIEENEKKISALENAISNFLSNEKKIIISEENYDAEDI